MGTKCRLRIKQKHAGELWQPRGGGSQPPTHETSPQEGAEPLCRDNFSSTMSPPPQPPSPPSPPSPLSPGTVPKPTREQKITRDVKTSEFCPTPPQQKPFSGEQGRSGQQPPQSRSPAAVLHPNYGHPIPIPPLPQGEPQNCSFPATQPAVAKATAPSPREPSLSNSQTKNPSSRTSGGEENPQNPGGGGEWVGNHPKTAAMHKNNAAIPVTLPATGDWGGGGRRWGPGGPTEAVGAVQAMGGG